MYLHSSHLPRLATLNREQKREANTTEQTVPIQHAYNNVDIIAGVAFAIVVVLSILICGLVKRSCIMREKAKSRKEVTDEKGPHLPAPPLASGRPSFAPSGYSDATVGPISALDRVPTSAGLSESVSRPSSAILAPHTFIPPMGSRPPSSLSVSTAVARPERGSGWGALCQRVDEKADARESQRFSNLSIARTIPCPPSPTSPRRPLSPIYPEVRLPSPASFKENRRHLYGGPVDPTAAPRGGWA